MPFLKGTEIGFMVQVALSLKPIVFAPGERPSAGRLYIIHRGIALYGGRMLTAGKVRRGNPIPSSHPLHTPLLPCRACAHIPPLLPSGLGR